MIAAAAVLWSPPDLVEAAAEMVLTDLAAEGRALVAVDGRLWWRAVEDDGIDAGDWQLVTRSEYVGALFASEAARICPSLDEVIAAAVQLVADGGWEIWP